MGFPNSIKLLVERFRRNSDVYCSPDYNETQVRIDFINPMFSALGWDMDNIAGYAEPYRDVVHEDAVRVSGTTKAPDYSFRIGGQRKFFLEAKRPSVRIKDSWEPAYQIRRYGWSAKLALSILTDFEEFAVYDCRFAPKQMEKASVARVNYINYQEYADRWDEIESVFSKDAILQGAFDRYIEKGGRKGTAEFDDEFLAEIEEWRKKLAQNLALRNDRISGEELNLSVQRIIDRIIFLRICEDRGIEPSGQLQSLLNGDRIYARLNEFFRKADQRYNSGLFHFEKERDRRELPDELTPRLEVDDATLKQIIRRLYYPESPYEFRVVSVDILGNVYERFLGSVIHLTSSHRAKVEPKPEVRKAGGVYYTPKYIVDYIIKSTVGKLVEGANPKRVAKLKIIDPACGSGSFLLGAYQFLLDWHHQWYLNDGGSKWAQGKNATLRPGPAGLFLLTSRERKRILVDNIFGVDIDYQAVEVTKLSLLLRVLEGETTESVDALSRLFHERALPDLGSNIKCGNSLIEPDIYELDSASDISSIEKRRINAFNWKEEFPIAFHHGGFDVVVGNPPYIFTRNEGFSAAEKAYFYSRYKHQGPQLNSFGIFLEQSFQIQRSEHGATGFITPNNWLTIDSFAKLRRQLITTDGELHIINILDRVFQAANVDTAIFTLLTSKGPRMHLAEMSGNQITFDRVINPNTILAPEYIIQVSALKQAGSADLIRKIESSSKPLSKFCTVSTGLKCYQTGKGKPPQTDEVKEARAFHADKKITPEYGKYLDGVDVQRYHLGWSGEFLKYGDWIAEPRRSVPFSGERILVRQIPSKPPYLVHATFTDKEFYNDINSMVLFTPVPGISLKYLLGVVNSRLLSFWFDRTYDKLQRKIFPQFKVKELARFPIRQIDFSKPADKQTHDRLVKLVDSIIDLRNRFSVSKTDHDQTLLRREIEAMDRRIDKLVYALYGLTDAETRLVENEAEN
jgi:type I restriction-modification system DNA methylase subunit